MVCSLEAKRRRSDCLVTLNPILGVELLVVAQAENEWGLAEKSRVTESRANRVDATLEGAKSGPGPGIACHLAVVISRDAQNKSLADLASDSPFEMRSEERRV